jgi:hypothetical protein
MKREKTVKIGVTIWNGHTYCSSGQQERALSVSSGPIRYKVSTYRNNVMEACRNSCLAPSSTHHDNSTTNP